MNTVLFVTLALVVVGAALAVQGTQTQQAPLRRLGVTLAVVGLIGVGLSRAFVVVPAGNVGVVFNVFGGGQDDEIGEGFHIILPVVQQVTLYDVRQQELTLSRAMNDNVAGRSSEGLEINVDATVLYQVIANEAAKLHQDIGPSYEAVRVRPEVRSQIRDAIGGYAAADLISVSRTELQQMVEDNLADALVEDNVRVLAVLMRDIRIPDSITTAIEEKQAAEQQVEVEENRRRQAEIAAQRRVIEAEGERDAAIARAEGEAEALRLRGESLRNNPEIIELEVAQRLAPGIETILLPSDNNFLLDLRSLQDRSGN